MVHNGIEYGDMQLIAEAYDLLHHALGLGSAELHDVFAAWNRGPLESFLIELTARIFSVSDPETGRALVELVDDAAGQKGTGKWTAQVAVELGVPIPTIAAAIDARLISSRKAERLAASRVLAGPSGRFTGERAELIDAVHDALYASKICSYAQGMGLIRAGSEAHGWGINLVEMARIWKGGCIIRARLLDGIMRAFGQQPALSSLILDEEFRAALAAAQPRWRRAVGVAQELGIPVPSLSASLAYYDLVRAARLPHNLVQAQRDAFGAHTYTRVDHPERGPVHTEWLK
jgi:6-phosphogluconate dehydrogenase